jgi:hypothetical protein
VAGGWWASGVPIFNDPRRSRLRLVRGEGRQTLPVLGYEGAWRSSAHATCNPATLTEERAW